MRAATVAEIREWPATVTVEQAARAPGISRSSAYAAVRAGEFPARSIKVRGRVIVITSSLLALLDPAPAAQQEAIGAPQLTSRARRAPPRETAGPPGPAAA